MVSRSILIVSGGRADFGLLLPVLRQLRAVPEFRTSVALTGQHLVAGMSDAVEVLAAESFSDVVTIDIGVSDEQRDAVDAAVACGAAAALFGRLLSERRPDLLLILGDRYEILSVVLAATLASIPVAHIAGGDLTHGAIDDGMRHAITVMSHLHLTTHRDAATRVRQLGEAPERIHVVGSPGLDQLRTVPAVSRAQFFAELGLAEAERLVLVTFHPSTRDGNSLEQLHALLQALGELGPDTTIVITGANADPGGAEIDRVASAFAAGRPNVHRIASLGNRLYAAGLSHAAAVVGNSSSGLYEAPSLGVPTINIGRRQDGRPRASSVIDCEPSPEAIRAALSVAFARPRVPVENPFGDGHASERIARILRSVPNWQSLLDKRFQDLAS